MRSTAQSPSPSPLTTQEAEISGKELLLHFREYKKMGTADDGEIVQLDDIVYAGDIAFNSSDSSDSVDHLPRIPAGKQICSLNSTVV